MTKHLSTLRSTAAAALGVFVLSPAFGDAPPPPVYVDMFETMFVGATKIEDLTNYTFPGGKADEYLERRSKIYQVPGEPDPIEVDRLYLVKKLPDGTITPAAPPADPNQPLQELDQPGGLLVQSAPLIANRIGVQMRHDHTLKEMQDFLDSLNKGMTLAHGRQSDRYFIVRITGHVEDAIKALTDPTDPKVSGVVVAEPDYPIQPQGVVPNDPRFGEQWHLQTIKAPDAWLTTVGHGANLNDSVAREKANKTIVAVIDTGTNNGLPNGGGVAHPDLTENIWVNPNDPDDTSNFDDDGIGGVNDTSGWNFVSNNKFPNDTSTDRHGTHVAGIIGARGNNGVGVSGVAWRVKLLPLKASTTSQVVLACNYVRALNNHPQQNVRVAVVNHSYGFPAFTVGLYNAINNSQVDTTVTPPAGVTATWSTGQYSAIAASGQLDKIKRGMTVTIPTSENPTRILNVWNNNDGTYTMTLSGATTSPGQNLAVSFPLCYRSSPYGAVHVVAAGTNPNSTSVQNLDTKPFFPACYPSDLIVTVGGSTQPTLAQPDEFPTKVTNYYSNTGWHSVDIFAPGIDILSTTTSTATGYGLLGGTSAAAAQVSGAVALMRMVYPTASDRQIVAGIIAANDPRPGLTWYCRTGGRLNVQKAVTQPLP